MTTIRRELWLQAALSLLWIPTLALIPFHGDREAAVLKRDSGKGRAGGGTDPHRRYTARGLEDGRTRAGAHESEPLRGADGDLLGVGPGGDGDQVSRGGGVDRSLHGREASAGAAWIHARARGLGSGREGCPDEQGSRDRAETSNEDQPGPVLLHSLTRASGAGSRLMPTCPPPVCDLWIRSCIGGAWRSSQATMTGTPRS